MLLRKQYLQTAIQRSIFFRTFWISSNSHSNQNVSANHANEMKGTTVSKDEMKQFQQYVSDWWRPGGPYDSLRALNELRVPLIKSLCNTNNLIPSKPLKGIGILDVGSGGGILSEPLSRLGADVVGIDPLEENVEAATHHSSQDPDLANLTYKCTDIETFSDQQPGKFDIVVASEVLEHVNNPDLFIRSCCEALKPGGHIVITTINRNLISISLAKYVAEYVLRIVPENTHDPGKFVTPSEVVTMLRKADMIDINFRGMVLNPLTDQWSWSNCDLINYACTAKKDYD